MRAFEAIRGTLPNLLKSLLASNVHSLFRPHLILDDCIGQPPMALATAERRRPKPKQKSFTTYSVDIEPHRYKQKDWFCRFVPRIHRDAHLADAGSWQCQLDFLGSSSTAREDVIRNQASKSYAVGSINAAVGNFTALCLSDALPDRLAMVSYMVEYAYIHDDGEYSDSWRVFCPD